MLGTRINVFSIAAAVMGAAACGASADVIKLKNGNVMEGEVLERSATELTVDIPDLGVMTFAADEVASIDTASVVHRPPPAPAAPAAPVAKELPPHPVIAESQPPPEPCVVESARIKAITCELTERFGAVEGQVVFRDKDGRFCATRGSLSIRKTVTDYKTELIFDSPTTSHEERVPVTREVTVTTIHFTPKSFNQVYGSEYTDLPIQLSPGDLRAGDAYILEWRSFRLTGYVMGKRES